MIVAFAGDIHKLSFYFRKWLIDFKSGFWMVCSFDWSAIWSWWIFSSFTCQTGDPLSPQHPRSSYREVSQATTSRSRNFGCKMYTFMYILISPCSLVFHSRIFNCCTIHILNIIHHLCPFKITILDQFCPIIFGAPFETWIGWLDLHGSWGKNGGKFMVSCWKIPFSPLIPLLIFPIGFLIPSWFLIYYIPLYNLIYIRLYI